MGLMKELIFDGKSSLDYGVYISGEGVYNSPERDLEMISVPGRNGDYIIDRGRFLNIDVTYPAGTFDDDQQSFAQSISDFRNAVMSTVGYCRLEDDYHPDEFRLASAGSGFEVAPVKYGTAGEFSLIFSCKPQRFLKSGETEITASNNSTITNPTLFTALPLITVQGTGNLTINGNTLTISGNGATVFIDCESQEAYLQGGSSANNRITFNGNSNFYTLKSGSNSISWTGLTSVKIKPRWWKI